MKVVCITSFLVAIMLNSADCVITGWTVPDITGAADGSGTVGPLAEDTADGATTITIAATNAEEYELLSQSPTTGATFTIPTSTSGVLSVANLDYETHTEYVLVIKAEDTGDNAVGTATVTLSLTDVNDNSPVFAATEYAFNVKNKLAAGKAVGTITATDADGTAANNVVTYTITAGNTGTDFAVDSATGAITVANQLDKTRTAGYSLTLTATSSGTGGLTTDVDVFIVVSSCSGAGAVVGGLLVTMVTVMVTMLL